MRKITSVLLTALATVSLFSIAIFTSCTKVNCDNVICQNGGTCSNGVCTCPTGYSGVNCETAAKTAIKYTNRTFTPIAIAVNGINEVIQSGASYTFIGAAGKTASGTATTSGVASTLGVNISGAILGELVTWNFTDVFPTSTKDTLNHPLDVGSTYFFLRITNKGTKDIIDYYVNYEFSYGNAYGDVTIPADGKPYDMGYYLAYPSSNVRTQSSALKVDSATVSLPFTSNQIYSFTAQ